MTNNPSAYTERVQTLICHTLNAQNIWTNRILRKPHTQGVWALFRLEDLPKLNKENHELSLHMLENCNISESITYVNTVGDQFTNAIADMIYHMINHGTYHRGQIITELKQNGVIPVSTDFIFYKR